MLGCPEQNCPLCAGVVDAFVTLDRALDATRIRSALAPDVELARFCSRLGGEHAVLPQPRSGCYYRPTGSQADRPPRWMPPGRSHAWRPTHTAAASPAGEAVELVEFLRRRGCLAQPSSDAFGS